MDNVTLAAIGPDYAVSMGSPSAFVSCVCNNSWGLFIVLDSPIVDCIAYDPALAFALFLGAGLAGIYSLAWILEFHGATKDKGGA